MMPRVLLCVATAILLGATGCAAVGELAQTVGSGLTDYSNKNSGQGFVAGAAGVAGKVYTKAGDLATGKPAPDRKAARE